MDDKSRYVVALRVFDHEREVATLDLLLEAIGMYGAPKRLYLDNGSPIPNSIEHERTVRRAHAARAVRSGSISVTASGSSSVHVNTPGRLADRRGRLPQLCGGRRGHRPVLGRQPCGAARVAVAQAGGVAVKVPERHFSLGKYASREAMKRGYAWDAGPDDPVVAAGDDERASEGAPVRLPERVGYLAVDHVMASEVVKHRDVGEDFGPWTEPGPFPRDFTDLVAGYHHVYGIRENGTVACWGDDNFSQLASLNPPLGDPIVDWAPSAFFWWG